MNQIRHCAFAVVLSLAVNRLPAQHPLRVPRVRPLRSRNGDELCGIQYVFTIPAGALVGIIVGSVVGGEHWDKADVPATVTFRPEPSGRVAVGVSLRF